MISLCPDPKACQRCGCKGFCRLPVGSFYTVDTAPPPTVSTLRMRRQSSTRRKPRN
ncbi:MAG: hypothetical protein NVV63_01785 [Opitutus sp.]|nr:hypothetical protein [Opitutus sp.]